MCKEPVDFIINQKPVSISPACPHCEFDMEIPWDEVDAPECWGDAWGGHYLPLLWGEH